MTTGAVAPRITLTATPPPEARNVLLAGLLELNAEKAGRPVTFDTLAVLLSDPSDDRVVGGLWGRTSWGHLYVDLLFVPAALRGIGLGTTLMRQAEEEALRRGCHGAWLDTFSFQARGFYERLGFRVFGTIDDYPRGHQRFFMSKVLQPA